MLHNPHTKQTTYQKLASNRKNPASPHIPQPVRFFNPTKIPSAFYAFTYKGDLLHYTTVTASDQWRRIEEVFQAALDIPESQRDAWLTHACAGDAQLRQEVDSLLAHDPTTAPSFPASSRALRPVSSTTIPFTARPLTPWPASNWAITA
jgi:hypothetical protein